jgi:hypothetical protein
VKVVCTEGSLGDLLPRHIVAQAEIDLPPGGPQSIVTRVFRGLSSGRSMPISNKGSNNPGAIDVIAKLPARLQPDIDLPLYSKFFKRHVIFDHFHLLA